MPWLADIFIAELSHNGGSGGLVIMVVRMGKPLGGVGNARTTSTWTYELHCRTLSEPEIPQTPCQAASAEGG